MHLRSASLPKPSPFPSQRFLRLVRCSLLFAGCGDGHVLVCHCVDSVRGGANTPVLGALRASTGVSHMHTHKHTLTH